MRAKVLAIVTMAAASSALAIGLPAAAASPKTPSKITSVTTAAGPGVGEITISFKGDEANTTGFRVVTGLSTFGSGSLPSEGRNRQVFTFAGHRHSITLSAAQVAAAGAAPATGDHLYFRLYAVNTSGSGTSTRAYPYLQAAKPRPVAPAKKGTGVWISTFNVRTAKASGDSRSWLRRVPDVAREIADHQPGIVALQELGPGRADGKSGSTNGTPRMTDSLQSALAKIGASRYQLTRTTPYVKAGTTHGTQGARILYDTKNYKLLSHCTDTTGKSHYSSSCSFELPIQSGESASNRRSAAYAEFESRASGERFFVVSAHLDHRHSDSASTEARYEALRVAQVKYLYAKLDDINPDHQQVVLGGDLNTWQNSRAGNEPHDYLTDRGFYDTAGAVRTTNLQYSTINHFDTKVSPGAQGYGPRLDYLLVKGAPGAKSYTNVLKVTDSSRPSDHNLQIAKIIL